MGPRRPRGPRRPHLSVRSLWGRGGRLLLRPASLPHAPGAAAAHARKTCQTLVHAVRTPGTFFAPRVPSVRGPRPPVSVRGSVTRPMKVFTCHRSTGLPTHEAAPLSGRFFFTPAAAPSVLETFAPDRCLPSPRPLVCALTSGAALAAPLPQASRFLWHWTVFGRTHASRNLRVTRASPRPSSAPPLCRL